MSTKTSFSLARAMAELEEIEKYFAQSSPDLDEAMKKHAQAATLGKEILAYLEAAQTTVEKVELAAAAVPEDEDTLN